MVMLAKFVVKCDVNDEADAVAIEKIIATAVAHYTKAEGHPGNANAVLKSLTPDTCVATGSTKG